MALDRPAVEKTIAAALSRAPDARICLVGTASSVLRGIPLEAADIDILFRERPAIDEWVESLRPIAKVETEAVWEPEANQYFSRLLFEDVTVELSTVEIPAETDTFECFGAGPWEHFDLVPCGDRTVPAVATELRLLTELGRGRQDRYEPIIEFLKAKACDLDLVRRGLVTLGAAPDAIERISGRLTTSQVGHEE